MSSVLYAGLVLAAIGLPGLARAEESHGLQLPAGTTRLDDGRFRTSAPYVRAVAHFEHLLKRRGIRFELEERAHTAKLKYSHFLSRDPATPYEHINVAAYDGAVYIVVLSRRPARQ